MDQLNEGIMDSGDRVYGGLLTNGKPQYVHMQIWGLSVLMKILGCPNGPPPPSHSTIRLCVHRTGCLWINSMAA